MRKKSHIVVVAILLYLVFFLYRIAFWDDFLFRNLLQIILNALFDVVVVFLFGSLINRILLGSFLKDKQSAVRLLVLISIPAVYYICVKLLKLLHFLVYTITVGFSKEFRRVFDLESYQIFDSYIVVAFGSAILLAFRFYEKWNIERIGKENAEKERAVAELNFLKAQINPHFIFNTLNNIHFMVDKSNGEARKVIHDFCELLRYQLYETGNENVNIKNEITYLEHYISLQKIRKELGFKVTFDVPENLLFNIAPLLLIVPVENAFKYSGSGANDYIHISMRMEPGNLFCFKVVNSIGNEVKRTMGHDSGLGLTNLQKRLDLFYGRDASLEYNIYNDHYEVTMTIKMKKDENH